MCSKVKATCGYMWLFMCDSVQAYRTDRWSGKTPSVPQLGLQDSFTNGNIAKPVKSPAAWELGRVRLQSPPNPRPLSPLFRTFY